MWPWSTRYEIISLLVCLVLHHVLVSLWAVWMCVSMGWAWLSRTLMTLRLLHRVETQCESAIVRCSVLPLPPSPSVFLLRCFSPSMIDASPPRTWLIFHLQPASQLLAELSPSPHEWAWSSARRNISSSEAMWFFGEPKDWSIPRLCPYMNHPVFRSPKFPEIRGWQISSDARTLPSCCHCVTVSALIPYMSHPLSPFPAAQK